MSVQTIYLPPEGKGCISKQRIRPGSDTTFLITDSSYNNCVLICVFNAIIIKTKLTVGTRWTYSDEKAIQLTKPGSACYLGCNFLKHHPRQLKRGVKEKTPRSPDTLGPALGQPSKFMGVLCSLHQRVISLLKQTCNLLCLWSPQFHLYHFAARPTVNLKQAYLSGCELVLIYCTYFYVLRENNC